MTSARSSASRARPGTSARRWSGSCGGGGGCGGGPARRLVEHDLAAVRAAPGWPGEEVARAELLGAEVARGDGPRRLALCVHVDVVGEGEAPWTHPRGAVADGYVWGRGSVDMKGGVV